MAPRPFEIFQNSSPSVSALTLADLQSAGVGRGILRRGRPSSTKAPGTRPGEPARPAGPAEGAADGETRPPLARGECINPQSDPRLAAAKTAAARARRRSTIIARAHAQRTAV